MANKDAIALYNLLKQYNVVSLAGLSKGAGKTTVLRALLEAGRQDPDAKTMAVAAIGVTASGPPVNVQAGTLVVTVTGCLRDCDFTKQILHTTGMQTPLGQVVVVKALSDGRAALAGPTTNNQLSEVTGYLIDSGAEQVIIDGAGERKTFASFSGGAVVFCAGAAYDRDMYNVVAETAYICRLLGLRLAPDQVLRLFPEAGTPGMLMARHWQDHGYFMCYGALTDEILEEAVGGVVVVKDAGKIFAGRRVLDQFYKNGGELLTAKPAVLAAVAINPAAGNYAFDAKAFGAAVRDAVPAPVFNVLENNNGCI